MNEYYLVGHKVWRETFFVMRFENSATTFSFHDDIKEAHNFVSYADAQSWIETYGVAGEYYKIDKKNVNLEC